MAKIKLEALQPGMLVCADVKNVDDTLLIPSGCILTEKHIAILQAWGVPEVAIHGSDGEPDPLQRLTSEQIAALEDRLRQRFFTPDTEHPAYREVFRILRLRQARRCAAPTD